MQHNFDVFVAKDYGLVDAILFDHIGYWVVKNKANEVNFHDGYYWTFNSIKAFTFIFPYLSEKKVRGALERLENNGLIITGDFNEKGYDRTKWYTLSQKGECIYTKGQMHLYKRANGDLQKGEPIPNINHINKPIEKENINTKEKPLHRQIPPTLEMVTAYCNERGNNVDPQRFIDHYNSNGWMVGKNKMKDWQASVRTWERNDDTPKKQNTNEEPKRRGTWIGL